jgi:Na+(H+)/acetate symporter ActP
VLHSLQWQVVFTLKAMDTWRFLLDGLVVTFLVASLLAPYLRKFGCYTVPDFVGTRYGGNLQGYCCNLVLTVASFTYVTAQINATGTIASVALRYSF